MLKNCLTCKKEFSTRKKQRKYCSVSCARHDPDIIERTKKTKIIKYGEDWTNSKKRIETINEKYGVSSFFGDPEVRKKSKNTLMERYGIDHNSLLRKVDLNKEVCSELYSQNKLSCSEIASIFNIKRTSVERKFKEMNIPLNKNNIQSKEERIIREYLDQLNISYITNDRSIISPKELDIFITSYNLAIEINGIYWHSDDKIDKNYHYNKILLCQEKGIKLLQFFDYEIHEKLKIVKSIIYSSLNKNKRIAGRKCIIFYPSKKETKTFMDENHIQGNIKHKFSIGLKYEDEIVSIMTFGVPRFNKNHDFELLRLCFKCGYSVIGGTEKMFKYFVDKFPKSSIISYSDNRLFSGNVYPKIGLEYIKNNPPSYFYFKNGIRLSRYQCQKHKLKTFLLDFDERLSEVENMKNNGFLRIWDAGTSQFITKKEI